MKKAWQEYGHLNDGLYDFKNFPLQYIGEEWLNRIPALQKFVSLRAGDGCAQVSKVSDGLVRDVIMTDGKREVVALDGLFTNTFCEHMLQELDHLQKSGIPQRRPNGMNRYEQLNYTKKSKCVLTILLY